MKNATLYLSFALLWLITNAADCSRNNNPDPAVCTEQNTVKFPQDALDRLFFKTGSYWVYTDSADHNLYDSVWVYLHNIIVGSKKENGHYKNKCYQYQYLFKENRFGVITREYFNSQDRNDETLDYTKEVFWYDVKNESGSKMVTRFLFMGNTYDTRFTGQVSFQDSIEIGNRIYFDNNACWAKNTCLIKYTDLNGTVWELIRFKVTQ
jgi:hypothetical protein